MKIHILSDVHLEFSHFQPPDTGADVVILAGDIGLHTDGLQWARTAFPHQDVIYVSGNHEYYGAERLSMLARLREEAASLKIHFLENDSLVIPGSAVRFLGATLWTDFLLYGEPWANKLMRLGAGRLNDFRKIRNGEGAFTPEDSVLLFQESVAWLNARLNEPFSGKTVVVTHHLPSMLSVPLRFREEKLSACFASHLDYLFGKAALWVHGHSHDNSDYLSQGTRVICNPRGYVTERHGVENKQFIPDLVVEI
jgi:predicted phosphodiesterase